jgi:hypothetical protein
VKPTQWSLRPLQPPHARIPFALLPLLLFGLTGCLDEAALQELFPETPSTQAPGAPAPILAPSASPTSAQPPADEDPPVARSADPILARLAAKPLRYTRHGRCRMDCRHISEGEVEALLADGHIDHNRTRHEGECVSYAVEGQTGDGQQVRIVYADCDRETRVVTTIDLGSDWPCQCQ